MSIIFVTTCSADYTKPWIFPTLGLLQDKVVCLLHPEDHRYLPVNCERRDYQAFGNLHQDGRFIHALPELKDDDVVVLLDVDGLVQRPLVGLERHTLECMNGSVALGYNVGPGERGVEEFLLLRPNQSLENTAKVLKVGVKTLQSCLVYNTGMMAARVDTWRKLYHLSVPLAGDGARDLFNQSSWPQYVICCLLAENDIPVTELGYEVHSHGHFPITPKHEIKCRQLYYDRKLVFFAHNIGGVTH